MEFVEIDPAPLEPLLVTLAVPSSTDIVRARIGTSEGGCSTTFEFEDGDNPPCNPLTRLLLDRTIGLDGGADSGVLVGPSSSWPTAVSVCTWLNGSTNFNIGVSIFLVGRSEDGGMVTETDRASFALCSDLEMFLVALLLGGPATGS